MKDVIRIAVMYVLSIWIASAVKHYIDLPVWMHTPMRITSYVTGLVSMCMFCLAARERLEEEVALITCFAFAILLGIPWFVVVLG